MILKADISKTSPARHLFLFIFMCGNSKCTRIQKIKNFSGEVNWVPLALIILLLDFAEQRDFSMFNGKKNARKVINIYSYIIKGLSH